ncbi:MAG TPA: DMT family transporter [Acidimicrobiia bacterium]|nr:DMT family transporter [Acidimicrobiia bacterium]
MSRPIHHLIWEDDDLAQHGRRLTRPAIYLLLATVVLLLGLNWPIMATGIQSISPIWMGVFRVAGAAVVVITIGAVQGKMSVPPRRDLPMIVSLAVFRLAAVFVLVFTALQMVPPGRSSVVVWTTSLWTVPIAAIFIGERMSGRRWVGLALGVAGVIVLFEPWSFDWEEPGVALGHALLILAAITNAATSVHIRGHRWTITPLEAIPWQLLGAAIPLVILGLIVEGAPVIDWTPQLVWIVLYQGMLATGIAFWAQIVILRNFSAVSTNLTLMAVPVVGVASSAILLGEEVTTALAIGLILVIVGVALNLLSDKEALDGDQPSEVV